MLIVISPAKTLNYTSELPSVDTTNPVFAKDTELLAQQFKKYNPAQLKDIMGISLNLASLNAERYANWQHAPLRPAIFAYNGDVYDGIDAYSLTKPDLAFAQTHLRIISGLYGSLKPLDNIKPYRAAFDNDLQIESKKDLYAYWGDKITKQINKDIEQTGDNILINLASQEYFNAIKNKALKAKVVIPVFKEIKNGKLMVISFFAKKARGMMTRFIIKNKITTVDDIFNFSEEGYVYNPDLSKTDMPVFTRFLYS